MTIAIDPMTHIITVPKADLNLLQASPEVRELDLNWFRMQLKSLEDNQSYNICMLKTHRHNTEVTLSGLVYARIIEILDPYTVEFEDDQYAVNCTGANHNLSDVKVANQVSLIINNAAGLISNAQIEYASFNGGVTIDTTNGIPGTLFPAGTPQQPTDNWVDALLIANVRGFSTFFVIGDSTINGSNDFSNKEIVGESPNKTTLTVTALSDTTGCEFKNANITGTLDGENFITDSIINDLTYVNGSILNCGLIGDIILDGNLDATMNDCYTVDQDDPPVIDMGSSGQSLAMPNYSGLLTLKNLNDSSQEIGIGFNAGMAIIENTIIAGTVIISGIGGVIDNSSGASIVDTSTLISNTSMANTVWEHADAAFMLKIIKNKKALVKTGSVWELIIYDDDDSTPILNKAMKDKLDNNITDLAAGTLAQEIKTSV